jgi:putative transposase
VRLAGQALEAQTAKARPLDGIIPTRAERLNHVWTWDFVDDRADNEGRLRILSILDEYNRECLGLHVGPMT